MLTLFPGIQESIINSVLHVPGLKAVVLKTFGSGNAPQKEWFIQQLKDATERGIIIVNITQCQRGVVEMGRYETGLKLLQAGVISGYDSTRMRSHQTNVPSRPWSQPGRNPLPHELRPCGRNHQSISHSQTTLMAKKINFPLLSKIPITIKLLKLKGKMSN